MSITRAILFLNSLYSKKPSSVKNLHTNTLNIVSTINTYIKDANIQKNEVIKLGNKLKLNINSGTYMSAESIEKVTKDIDELLNQLSILKLEKLEDMIKLIDITNLFQKIENDIYDKKYLSVKVFDIIMDSIYPTALVFILTIIYYLNIEVLLTGGSSIIQHIIYMLSILGNLLYRFSLLNFLSTAIYYTLKNGLGNILYVIIPPMVEELVLNYFGYKTYFPIFQSWTDFEYTKSPFSPQYTKYFKSLNENYTKGELRKMYREMSKKYHPDRNVNGRHEDMTNLNNEYDNLKYKFNIYDFANDADNGLNLDYKNKPMLKSENLYDLIDTVVNIDYSRTKKRRTSRSKKRRTSRSKKRRTLRSKKRRNNK